ncbi:hypothetical protein TNCV_4152101 [Trichonephila clavipes]|nr:hypothetical protein TNCV_4152101 [Trichonephila clavipes]
MVIFLKSKAKSIIEDYALPEKLFATIEQRTTGKLHMKLEETTTVTVSLFKEVYVNECLLRARVFESFKSFRNGRHNVEEDSCPDSPSTSNIGDSIKKNL